MIAGSADVFAGAVDRIEKQEGEKAQEVGIAVVCLPKTQMCQRICHSRHTAAWALISCRLIKPAGDPQAGEGDQQEIGKSCGQDFQPKAEYRFCSLSSIHVIPLFSCSTVQDARSSAQFIHTYGRGSAAGP